MAISKEVYSQLRDRFWDVASWAIWTPPKYRVKDNMGDLSVFNSPDLLDKLNTVFMFVGICGSGVHDDYVDKSKPWWNFHSSSPDGNDYRLRDATVGTPAEGSYITDFIKYHDEINSKVAKAYLLSHPDVLEEVRSAIMKEIELQGGDPIIFPLGNDCYELVTKYLPKTLRVVKVPHYSGPVNADMMKAKIMNGIRLLNKG